MILFIERSSEEGSDYNQSSTNGGYNFNHSESCKGPGLLRIWLTLEWKMRPAQVGNQAEENCPLYRVITWAFPVLTDPTTTADSFMPTT